MIMEKAQELGLAISESAEFRRMLEAKEAMDSNDGVQAMMQDYTDKRDSLVNLMEMGGAAKEAMMDLSRQIDELQSALMRDPDFIEMMEAQQGFRSLMQAVNKTIAACIGMEEPDMNEAATVTCNGSCATCAGCKH